MFTQPKIKMARYADRYRNHELQQFEYYNIDNVLSVYSIPDSVTKTLPFFSFICISDKCTKDVPLEVNQK
jgi:hypothetical protein